MLIAVVHLLKGDDDGILVISLRHRGNITKSEQKIIYMHKTYFKKGGKTKFTG